MLSVPEGRAANQPLAVTTFRPPIGASLPGAFVNLATIGSAAGVGAGPRCGHRVARQLLQPRLLFRGRCGVDARVARRAELRRQRPVVLARVLAGPRGDLGGEQVRHEPVLVRRPHGPVAPQERRTRALLAAEADRPAGGPLDEPLEPDRPPDEPPPE